MTGRRFDDDDLAKLRGIAGSLKSLPLTGDRNLNPYDPSPSVPPTPPRTIWRTHWALDALITTWIAVGTSALALAVVGAIVLEGSLISLVRTDDAWVGVVFTPIVAGFVFVGAAIGSWLELKPVGCLIGIGTLCIFAIVLILADYFDDLGEGEQIVTYYGIGLLVGGVFSAPAFFVRGTVLRTLFMTLPHLVLMACFAAFLIASA